jgi:hypothetical protein
VPFPHDLAGRPYAGTPANLCAACATQRCVKCGAETGGGVVACLCGSCGVTAEDCVKCGGPAGE